MRDPRTLSSLHAPLWPVGIRIFRGRELRSLVWLMGPEGNQRVLAREHDNDFSWYEGYSFAMEPMFGRDILFLLDGAAHRKRYGALVPAFGSHAVASYLPAFERIVAAHIARWPSGGVVDLASDEAGSPSTSSRTSCSRGDDDDDSTTRSRDRLGLFTAFTCSPCSISPALRARSS